MEVLPVALLFTTLVFFFLIGMPIAYCLCISSLVYLLAMGNIPLQAITQKMVFAGDNFVLLSIPLFILAAHVMNTTETTQRIFRFANTLVRHFRGGLAHVNVLSSMIFAGMSGSALADVAGPGLMEYEAMKSEGYDEDFSIAVTAASSSIGPIIPPSIPFVIYGWISGVSVGQLFIAGFVPGCLMGFLMMVTNYFVARRRNYPRYARATFRELWQALLKAFLPLMAPALILGGIYTGVVTPTEAAMVATIYAIGLGVFAYRKLKAKDFSDLCLRVVKDTAIAMFIVSSATVFNWILTREQIPIYMSNFILQMGNNKFLILIAVNIFFLMLGMFMENTAIMVIFTPIMLPIMANIGISPVHFGIIFTLNLMIGLLTPPFGIVLYMLSAVTKLNIARISKALIPFYISLIATLLLVTYVPEISMFLPRLLTGK